MRKIIFCIRFGLLTFLRFLFSFCSSSTLCQICSKKSILIPLCGECQKKYFSVPCLSENSKGFDSRSKKEFSENFCEKCGKRLFSEIGRCLECRETCLLQNVDRIFPIFSYRLWNENLLCRWKLEGERSLSLFFASKVKERLKDLRKEVGDYALVPVPPRKGKIRKEGWDQIDELSKILKFLYDEAVLELLERNSFVQQKTLSREQRLETIENAYSLRKKINFPLPERVIILDDVMTTGATLEGIAKILKKNGVKEVYGLTIFTVD
ncbi:MAG: hypothetical protein K6E78_09020 [Treponema sp.]|nr:hypothetical protein [Treponema sp.]